MHYCGNTSWTLRENNYWNKVGLFDFTAASQNGQSSGWEAKAVEFFVEQLKEKEAQSLVTLLG